jgi:hypothetical protein
MVFNQGPHHTAAQKDLLSRTKPHCRSCPSELWARDNRTHGRAFAWRSSKIHETKQTQGSRAKSSFRRSPPSEATTRDKKSPSQSLALLTFPSASAVASRCEQPRTLMASRWVRPEVRATLSLSLSVCFWVVFLPCRCTRCSQRRAWPSASAGCSCTGTSPATPKSGADLSPPPLALYSLDYCK